MERLTQLPTQGVPGTFTQQEADHAPPPNAKVKNAWSYTSIPEYVLEAFCLIKQEVHLHSIVLN